VTKPEDIAEYEKWLGGKKMFMTRWDRKAVDAQWKFLEVVQSWIKYPPRINTHCSWTLSAHKNESEKARA
jgi:hypothetical protein